MKCKTVIDPDQLAHWYAAWVGVAPEQAIPCFEKLLSSWKDDQVRLKFAMQFITLLLGGRRGESSNVREAYRTAAHLKSLYLLMHRYIRQRDDIERAGKGVYSPGLRDNAQDARNHLFKLLTEIPGKEAYLALMEISRAHPERSSRPWFEHHAKVKAEQDSELGAWSIEQFCEFNELLERTPSNHRQLFDLACSRLEDLRDDLENGDSSLASILKMVRLETEVRKFIGGWLRDKSGGRYSIPQEEELADATRPDIRFHGAGFDCPIPVELKLADNWTGPHLFERLETQLCGQYLRDVRSSRGIFALVYRGEKREWTLPKSGARVDFGGLINALRKHWLKISARISNAEEVAVVGINLTKRAQRPPAF
jgi:hypothetical protein